uniref:Pentatricopeptide repeat-containing protein n=1 Tax=Kalanchoe fedtschenkoi TaxID=63787 RepID=A0A7N0UQP5_KALFE
MNKCRSDPRTIHARIIKCRPPDKAAYNGLIHHYSKSQLNKNLRQTYALRVFHVYLSRPTVVSWTCLISALGDTHSSLTHFVSMLRYGTMPNQRTLAVLLKACAALCTVSFGMQVHGVAHKMSLSTELFAGSALVNFYSKSGRSDDAWKLFGEMPERDPVSYSAVIVGLAQNSQPVDALSCFADMVACGVPATEYSVSAALTSVGDMAVLEPCRILHGHAVVTGHYPNVVVGTSLLDAYGKCGLISEARQIFDELLPDMNLVGWNAMMSSYAQQGESKLVLDMFTSMNARGFTPDEYSFLAVLSCLQNAGLADQAEGWLNEMKLKYGVEPQIEHYTCVVGALSGVGRLKEAVRVATSMPFEPDGAMWRTLLIACASHGDADMAETASNRLLELDPHDDSAYIILANILSNKGKLAEVAELRKKMKNSMIRRVVGRSWL